MTPTLRAGDLPEAVVASTPVVRLGRALARSAAALLFALPLLLALPLALSQALDISAWRDLLADPQVPRALGLSLQTALLSTAMALLLTLWLLTLLHGTALWHRLTLGLGPMLAVPHAAFAIGLAWLMAPAGWLARLLAPLFGWDSPPPWTTVNDPQGGALVLVLVLKEVPFLLWSALALLTRPEVAQTLTREVALARTLGYTARAWWWRVGWLMWLPRLAWPSLAVLTYGLTVVDLALIIGPGSPPTLAVLTWQHLSDANAARNAQGAASALALSLVLAGCVVLAWLGWRAAQCCWLRRTTRGDRPTAGVASGVAGEVAAGTALNAKQRPLRAWAGVGCWVFVYAAVVTSLLLMSFVGVWRFPARWPDTFSMAHWLQIGSGIATLGLSAGLGTVSAVAALALTVAWLEAAPPAWDQRLTPLVLAPLVLPHLLLMVGLYRGALALHLDGTLLGLWWVHLLMVTPYVFTALAPAWRSFDQRLGWAALTLGRSRWAFWWQVKWPLLAAPLASALAIGFAVSVAQYLSTQFIGAGRHATLTTEAVTLASGGQRSMSAAFAFLQALLPALGFAAAHWAGRRAARSVS